jgi:hypothetical protein
MCGLPQEIIMKYLMLSPSVVGAIFMVYWFYKGWATCDTVGAIRRLHTTAAVITCISTLLLVGFMMTAPRPSASIEFDWLVFGQFILWLPLLIFMGVFRRGATNGRPQVLK